MSDTDESTNLTRTTSKSDGLADTESYRDLLQNKETMYLMKKEIQNLVDLRLQDMGISPEWQRIPDRTYLKTMKVLKHQTEVMKKHITHCTRSLAPNKDIFYRGCYCYMLILKKIIPNFERTKIKLDKKISRKCEGLHRKTKTKLHANCTKSNKNILKEKSTLKINKEIETTPIENSPTIKQTTKKRSSRPIKDKEKTAKPQQNIVKIMCRTKCESTKSSESLNFPAKRESVTISNPILFETQDSSSESDEKPKSPMKNVIEELKLNFKGKIQKNTNIKTSADNESENSYDTRSPDLKRDVIQIKSKYKSNTSKNSGESSEELSLKELGKNMTRSRRKYKTNRAKKNILEANNALLETRLQKTGSKIRFENVSSSDSAKEVKKKEEDQKYFNVNKGNTKKDISKNCGINNKINMQREKEKTEQLEKRIVSIFNVKSSKVVEQSEPNQKAVQTNLVKKLVVPTQALSSQEPITKINSNDFGSFDSSSDDDIIEIFKNTKDLKNVQKFPDTHITRVLPNIKKSVGEKQVGNKLKKVLFDVDND